MNPRTFTIPLCRKCNNDLGASIEGPVSHIFEDLESGQGISDNEAELLIRWLWKFERIAWSLCNPNGTYNDRRTIRNRVMSPLDDEVRGELTLAIALVETIDPDFGDAPMGIDSKTEESAIYVAGVFSRIAMMVVLRELESEVPPQFSLYQLAHRDAPDRSAKLFFPKTGFRDCVQAVGVTFQSARYLSYAHDFLSRNMNANDASRS